MLTFRLRFTRTLIRPLVLSMINVATSVIVLNKVVFHHAATDNGLVCVFCDFVVDVSASVVIRCGLSMLALMYSSFWYL